MLNSKNHHLYLCGCRSLAARPPDQLLVVPAGGLDQHHGAVAVPLVVDHNGGRGQRRLRQHQHTQEHL